RCALRGNLPGQECGEKPACGFEGLGTTAKHEAHSTAGEVLLGVMFKAGAILYRKLFVTSAEADLVTLTGTLEKFVRKDGKPLLILSESSAGRKNCRIASRSD